MEKITAALSGMEPDRSGKTAGMAEVWEGAAVVGKQEKEKGLRWIRDFICGALIGAGAILPGISGGVLAVIFDIYRPFMEVLAHPKQAIPKYWIWFLPIIIGWCIGFLGFAKGIAAALHLSSTVTTWLFIGLIAGTLPQLTREAGKGGYSAAAWGSFLLTALLVFAGLFHIIYVAEITVRPDFWWYVFCGVLWGLGAVIPGMTSSSIMMALGLYQPIMSGLSELDFTILGAALPAMLMVIFLLARVITWLLRTHYAVIFHGILGMVVASTLVIIPVRYSGWGEAALSAVCCLCGFALAYAMAKTEQRSRSNP